MGIPIGNLPDAMLSKMDKADRAPMGKAGKTFAEACVVKDGRAEKELQRDMANLLNQRNVFYVQSRMDKKTTLPKGFPDFFIALRPFVAGEKPRLWAVEAKVEGGSVSEDQDRIHRRYHDQTGDYVTVVWNLEQFRRLLDQNVA